MVTARNRRATPAPAAIDDAAIARLAKALGHPARVRIVRLLLERRSCIGGDIVLEVGLAQSTVSEHLRILKAAGVITGEIERPRVCYALAPAAVQPLADLLAAIAAHDARLDPDCCS
ncbi:MAG: ArsR/SmtB family transcription factor [Gammaproteobacteria bacterium]